MQAGIEAFVVAPDGAPRTECALDLGGYADGPNGGRPARLSANGSGRAWRPRGDVLQVVELLVVRPRQDTPLVAPVEVDVPLRAPRAA